MTANLSYQLHLSNALAARRQANVFAAEARSIYCDSEQAEMCRDYSADFRREARAHIAAAREAIKPRAVRFYLANRIAA
jgi:hypothetical protein